MTTRHTGRRRIGVRPFAITGPTDRTITVYRVEHPTSGLGPYQHEGRDVDAVVRLVDNTTDRTSCQPTARIDFPEDAWCSFCERMIEEHEGRSQLDIMLRGNPFRNILYGFANLVDLRRWFGDSFIRLSQEGYVIATYRVTAPGYLRGGSQVAFHTDFARRTGVVPFVDAMAGVPLLPRLSLPADGSLSDDAVSR